MREYKFCGRRIDTGEWVYGYLLITQMSGVYIIGTKTKSTPHKIGGEIASVSIRDVVWQYEVDPATVCQYTGLHDKNGRESYEHDIVKIYIHNGLYPDEWIAEIVFEKGQFGIRYGDLYKKFYPLAAFFKSTKKEYVPNVGEVTIESEPMFEVIGNPWDNPELLKEVE